MIVDLDFAEQKIGKGHRVMSHFDLLEYSLLWTEKLFEFPLVVDSYMDRKRCRDFKEMYGGDAGLILKWLFSHRNGLNNKGKKFKFTFLTPYHKDWHDEMLEEARRELKREEERLLGVPEKEEFVTANEFLQMMKKQKEEASS